MNNIRYGNSVISYTIVKTKRRKTSEIIVNENGIEIRTPITKKDSEIRQLVDEKKQWIFKKKLEFSDRIKKQKMRKTRSLSAKELEDRTWRLASKIGVRPSKVVIKKLKDRWGSSTKDGVINLNSALLEAPLKVVDYVVLHELCHLKIREHSYMFWSFLRKFMPNYQNQKKWLDLNGQVIL